MSTQIFLENFEKIYKDTYDRVLRFIICKCSNIEDVNDLVQETYTELYNILKNKDDLELENPTNYIIGIAKKKIKRYYGILYKFKTIPLWDAKENNEETLPAAEDIDIDARILNNYNANEVWEFIKTKNAKVIKIFYLFYYCDLKIIQIADELQISESNVKNTLYRTVKEIKNKFKLEGDMYV